MAIPPDPRELLASLGARRIPNTSLTVGPSAPTRPVVMPTRRTQSPPRQVAPPSGTENTAIGRMIASGPPQQAQDDQPWYKDLGQAVLGNGVVQGALKPLDWLQTGGRAAVAGIENAARAMPEWAETAVDAVNPITATARGVRGGLEAVGLDGAADAWSKINSAGGLNILDEGVVSNIDEDRENIGSWWDRATDSTYGYGTAMKQTGNKWVDRGRGLSGDIMLDPLTYVTAGSAQAAGKTSRMALSAKAARLGMDGEKVATIGRKGVAYLTDAERALLGVERSGLRFMGQRIAGTGGLARTVGKATSGVRHQVFGRRPWQYVARTPEGMFGVDLTEAYRVLNEANYQGRMSPRAAAALIDLDEGLRQYGKSIQVPASQVASKIFDGVNDEGRRAITRALEAGEDSALRPLNQELKRLADEAGVQLGDLGENFISHIWTDDALRFIKDIKDPSGKTVKGLRASGTTKERAFTGGVYEINGEAVDFGRGTIEEINRALTEKFGRTAGVSKWLEDDARVITSAYIDMIRNDIAITAAFQDAIRNHPNTFEWLDNVSDEVIDKAATKTANKEAAKALKELLTARKAAFKAEVEQASKDAVKLRDVLVARFTEQAAQQDEIAQRFGAAVKAAHASGKSLDEQAKAVTKQAVEVRKKAEQRLAKVEKEFFEIEQQLDAAKIRLAAAHTDQARLGEFARLAARRQELMAEVEQATAARARIDELTQQAAELFDQQRALQANLDDPDFVREVAQSLVPDQEVEVQRLAELPQQKLDSAAVRLRAVDEKIAALDRNLAEASAEEVSKLDEALSSIDDAVGAARQSAADAEAAVRAGIANVARGRAQREGASPLTGGLQVGAGVKFDVDLIASTSARMAELEDVVGKKAQFSDDWATAGKKLREANTVEAIADGQLRNLRRGEERLKGKIDDVTDRRARLVEASSGDGFRPGTPESVRKQFDAQMDAAIEKAVDEAVALRRRVWLIRDEMAKVAQDRIAARRGVQEALQESRTMPRSAEALNAELVEAQAALDAAVAKLPEPEQRLLEAYDALKAAQDKVKGLEGVRRNIERQRDRAARLSTPERQKAALEASRKILKDHLEANPNFSRPVYETVKDTIPGPELPPLAQLRSELEALPTSKAMAPPKEVRAAIEKVQLKSRMQAADIARGGNIDKDVLAIAPKEVKERYFEIKKDLRVPLSARSAAEQKAVVDEANDLAEFMLRYKAAIDAGAEGGDELATRVARELFKSKKKKFTEAIADLERGIDAPGPRREKVLRKQFDDKMLDAAAELDIAEKRLAGLRRQLKKLGGADTNEVREQLGELGTAAEDRAAVVFAIAQAKQDVETLRSTLSDMVRLVSPKADDPKVGLVSGKYRGTKAAPSLGGTYAYHPNNRSIATGFIIPRPGDKAGRAIELGSQRAAQEKAAYYRDMVDVLRGVVRKGDTVRGATTKQRELLDRLYDNMPERYRAALLQDTKQELADAQRNARIANRDMNRLGKAPETKGAPLGEVVADWRDVMFGRQGTIETRRSKLLEQLGFYDQATAKIEGDLAAVDAARRANFAEQRQLQPTAERLEGAQAELDALPSVRDAGRATQAAAQAEVDDLAARQARVVEQADALDSVLRRVDDAAAERFKEIDQQRLSAQFMVDVNGDWQKQAKDIATDLKRRASTAGRNKANNLQAFRELDELAKVAGDSPEMAQAFALHSAFVDTLTKLGSDDMTIKQMDMFLKRAKEGKLTKVFKLEAERGFRALDSAFAPGGRQLAYSDEVGQAFARLNEAAETGELWKILDRMTQFFKTYATATPGFHVRNAMSATFMNISDGVSLEAHREASRSWKRYLDDPQGLMRELRESGDPLDRQRYDAFQAIFGSGAGGNFSAAELGNVHSKIMDNPWTRWNRRQGERVEGIVRFAAAFDTIKKGGDVRDAMRRVERLHFDYSKLSKLDKGMKRIIPFWTFLSRNLPLQMQQMYMRPGVYSAFNHVADNVGVDVEAMPQWLADRSAIAVGGNDQEGYTAFSPDLPHLNLGADLETLDVRNIDRVLSNLNPVAVAPIEALSNKNFYFDGPIGTKQDRAMHALTSIVSPVAQGMRLSGTGRYNDRQLEGVANFFGIPYRNITPERMAAEMRRRAYEGG